MPRKTLLVVAPGLLDCDRHAGSRRLSSWLRILATKYAVAFHMLQGRVDGESERYAQASLALGVTVHPAHRTALAHLVRRIDHGVLFDQDLHGRLSRNGLEHARARWDPSEVAPRLLDVMGRLPMLAPKRLGAGARLLVRGRATYESSGAAARIDRLSSLLSWYRVRLGTMLTGGAPGRHG